MVAVPRNFRRMMVRQKTLKKLDGLDLKTNYYAYLIRGCALAVSPENPVDMSLVIFKSV